MSHVIVQTDETINSDDWSHVTNHDTNWKLRPTSAMTCMTFTGSHSFKTFFQVDVRTKTHEWLGQDRKEVQHKRATCSTLAPAAFPYSPFLFSRDPTHNFQVLILIRVSFTKPQLEGYTPSCALPIRASGDINAVGIKLLRSWCNSSGKLILVKVPWTTSSGLVSHPKGLLLYHSDRRWPARPSTYTVFY